MSEQETKQEVKQEAKHKRKEEGSSTIGSCGKSSNNKGSVHKVESRGDNSRCTVLIET